MSAKPFDPSRPLKDATAQEIQLELIRRSKWNELDGERVLSSLLAHRELWEAVMMDRICIMRPGQLPANGFIKLRDLPFNVWNVDTLYILTPDKTSAQKLTELCEQEDWGGMARVHADPDEVDDALGTGRSEQAIVSIWWD